MKMAVWIVFTHLSFLIAWIQVTQQKKKKKNLNIITRRLAKIKKFMIYNLFLKGNLGFHGGGEGEEEEEREKKKPPRKQNKKIVIYWGVSEEKLKI